MELVSEISLADRANKLEDILFSRLSSLGVELPSTCLKTIIRNLDLHKHYDIITVESPKYLKKFFNSGYKLVKTDDEDYVERYRCYTIYGHCRPGYVRGSRQIGSPYIKDNFFIGVKTVSSLGYSKVRDFICDECCTLIIYKEGNCETL